jgi:hypothetical protein
MGHVDEVMFGMADEGMLMAAAPQRGYSVAYRWAWTSARASEAQKARVGLVCSIVDAARSASGPIPYGGVFRKCGVGPYDIAPVLANRLVHRVDPEALGADSELEEGARRPGVFRFWF